MGPLLILLTCVASLSSCDDLEDTYPDLPECFDELVANGATLDDDRQNCGKCFNDCGPDNVCHQGECTADRNWALWPIPDLPHTADNYQIDDEVVLDLTTTLEWQRHASSQRIPMDGTRAYCEELEIDDRDWRLPTRIELVSIVDFTRALPAINAEVFPDTPSAEFKHDRWAESAKSRHDRTRDQIDFSEGSTIYYPDGADNYVSTLQFYVRCVRNSKPAEPMGNHYEIDSDTVLDTKTRLRWARTATPQCITSDCPPDNQITTYDEAVQYCEDLVLGDYDDFRVPNILELHSIVYPYTKHRDVRMDPDAFPDEYDDLDSGFYSSTMYAPSVEDGDPWPWMIKFQTGEAHRDLGATRVRCVRSERE